MSNRKLAEALVENTMNGVGCLTADDVQMVAEYLLSDWNAGQISPQDDRSVLASIVRNRARESGLITSSLSRWDITQVIRKFKELRKPQDPSKFTDKVPSRVGLFVKPDPADGGEPYVGGWASSRSSEPEPRLSAQQDADRRGSFGHR